VFRVIVSGAVSAEVKLGCATPEVISRYIGTNEVAHTICTVRMLQLINNTHCENTSPYEQVH
jgi:hypothetical protein